MADDQGRSIVTAAALHDASVPTGVTPEWLADILHASDLPPLSQVSSIVAEAIGGGLMADLQRLTVHYDGPAGTAPRTLVCKRPSPDPAVVAFAGAIGLYGREVRFYREVAPMLDVRTPRLFHGALSDDDVQFLLLLEDIAPVQPVDQVQGCTLDQAALVMELAGRMHGSSWDNHELLALDWLRGGFQLWAGAVAQASELAAGFQRHFDGRLEDEYLALTQTLASHVHSWLALMEKPRCLWHGDFRLDNMGFGIEGSADPLVVYDWQVVTLGAPAVDVSFFLGSGLAPSLRQGHEQDLVRIYYDSLSASGVTGYSWEQCLSDYRTHTISGLLGILLAFAKAAQTEESDQLLMGMARAYGRQIIDCDAFAFL